MDTCWSATPKFLASPVPGCGYADVGKVAALAMAGKRHFGPDRARPDPVRWSGLSAGACLRRGFAGPGEPI